MKIASYKRAETNIETIEAQELLDQIGHARWKSQKIW